MEVGVPCVSKGGRQRCKESINTIGSTGDRSQIDSWINRHGEGRNGSRTSL